MPYWEDDAAQSFKDENWRDKVIQRIFVDSFHTDRHELLCLRFRPCISDITMYVPVTSILYSLVNALSFLNNHIYFCMLTLQKILLHLWKKEKDKKSRQHVVTILDVNRMTGSTYNSPEHPIKVHTKDMLNFLKQWIPNDCFWTDKFLS